MEQIFPPAVLGVLEALGHDLRRLEPGEIDLFVPVAGKKQVEPAVAVVVEPHRCIGVDPCGQSRLLTDRREPFAAVVVKELGTAVLVEEQILVAVVVVVAPHRTHRDARPGAVDVGDAQLARNVCKRHLP